MSIGCLLTFWLSSSVPFSLSWSFIVFHSLDCIYWMKFYPFFVSGVNGIFSLISFSVCLSFVYRKTINFYVLIFHYPLLFSPARPTESTFYFAHRIYYTLISHTCICAKYTHIKSRTHNERQMQPLYFKSSFLCLTPSPIHSLYWEMTQFPPLQLNKTPLCIYSLFYLSIDGHIG